MTPIYELSLANKKIHNRLERLEIQDFAENRGDTLTIRINGRGLAKPRVGIPISIKIGYKETTNWDAGTFIIQEVEREEDAEADGIPNLLTLRGISQPQGGDGQPKVQTTKAERVWQDKDFDEVTSEIITSIGLKPQIDPDVGKVDGIKVKLPPIIQRSETDAQILDRLARERNAFVKYHNDQVIIQKYDSAPIKEISIARNQIVRYHFVETQRPDIDKVVAKYTDIKNGKTLRTTAGRGSESIVLPKTYPDKETAQQAANARLSAFLRDVQTITITLPTQPGMFAEKIINLTGFDDAEINQKYNTRAVITRLDYRGLRSKLYLESIPKPMPT